MSGSTTVAFQAQAGPSNVEISGETRLILPVTLTNEAQAYDSRTGRVTIAVDGVYLFLVSVGTFGHESAKVG